MEKQVATQQVRPKRDFNRPRGNEGQQREKPEFEKRVLQVDRVARTVRGGKRIRFRALVIMGNRNGKVGIGIGKATEVVDAVAKASKIAQKNMIDVKIKNETIPNQIEVRLGSSHIILKPARPGTSIVAGGAIRAICELSGIKNIVAKILGSANKINNSKATIQALTTLSKENNGIK